MSDIDLLDNLSILELKKVIVEVTSNVGVFDSIEEAIKLAFRLKCNVEVIHNNYKYLVMPNSIIEGIYKGFEDVYQKIPIEGFTNNTKED